MESFAEWFGTQRLAVLRFATVLCLDPETAQDVVQEVAYRAHVRWSHISDLDRPEAYLRRMVINEYLTWRRKWGRVVASSDLVESRLDRAGQTVGHDAVRGVDDRHQLQGELAKLSSRERVVIVLRFYEDMDPGEIAATLGWPRGTVSSLQARALRRLRVAIEDTEADLGRTAEIKDTARAVRPTSAPHRLVAQPISPVSKES